MGVPWGVCIISKLGGELSEYLGASVPAVTLKTLPCAIDSGTYPYKVKAKEPPPGF